MAEKTRYSDAELEEFRAIINEKLELAQRDYELLKASLTGAPGSTSVEVYPGFAGRIGTHREQNVWYLP